MTGSRAQAASADGESSSGLTPREALLATSGFTRATGADRDLGTIQPA
jgi:hypothetical protein